eukprot:358328-Chlamydomonas_euryale.AAC.2
MVACCSRICTRASARCQTTPTTPHLQVRDGGLLLPDLHARLRTLARQLSLKRLAALRRTAQLGRQPAQATRTTHARTAASEGQRTDLPGSHTTAASLQVWLRQCVGGLWLAVPAYTWARSCACVGGRGRARV